MTNFIGLHNQTEFSLLDSLITPKGLFQRAKELGQVAVAITDHGSIGAAWDAFKAYKETGVKLIIGCECYFVDDAKNITDKLRHVVFLAKNAAGYKNLLTLNKRGFDQGYFIGKRIYPIVDWELMKQHAEGLICLTACGNGIINQLLMNKKYDEAEATLLKLKEIFGENLGLEIQANNMKRGSNIYNDEIDQQFLNRKNIDLGKKHDVRVVPTCNAHYLRKEDSEVHDVFLAIGSHQPIFSNYRLRYPVPEFYLKTGDEVKAFFARNYGEEFAEQICANTVYFAEQCEKPDWIDPKFSNPSGKELPIFPVKDEPDYSTFRDWVSHQPVEVAKLEEDKLYLRYRCEQTFETRIKGLNDENRKSYQDRLVEELEVIEFHGFSSYMLIVADFIAWARAHDIAVGEGRGCLTGDTKVLTKNGFQRLDSIKVGEYVYSHTGNLRKVLNVFKFDVSKEKLLKIKTKHSFGDTVLTKDHELYGYKRKETEQYKRLKINNQSFSSVKRFEKDKNPNWLEAESFQKNDEIYTTFPIREYVKSQLPKQYKIFSSSTKNSNLDLEHFINVDKDFMYFIGRFVGNGWIRVPNKNGYNSYSLGIAFNSQDKIGINRFKYYFKKNNIKISLYTHKSKKLVQLLIHNESIVDIFKSFFTDYQNTSDTKHLPIFFRELSNEYLLELLNGIIDSDGSRKEKTRCGYDSNRISIDSVSQRLILEIKEMLLFLKAKSSILCRKEFYHGTYLCKPSFKLRFNKTDLLSNELGYYSDIINISEVNDNYVYDITVDQDHSYLTSNYIVHNSVGGSLIGFLLGIHQADPIKYNLIFARFHNKEKSSFPDIDTDFAPSGRARVQDYLRKKYGEDHVAHVSNVNTITPKVYVRDIARSCELGGSRETAIEIGNAAAGCIPSEIHNIEDAINKIPMFGEYCKRHPVFEKYKEICGKYRAWSTHAGGIIISARPLTGLIPMRKDKDGSWAIEYDKDKAEENGLVKMDTLGLSTLDIIGETYRIIKKRGKEPPPDVMDYDTYDKPSYDLITSGDTLCIFQLGTSGGTIDLCKRIHPVNINDLANINALARPSARDMRNDFINVRDGKKPMSLLHPNLGRAFNSTYGFGLYEECLMYLAQDIAGWSLHSADRLRKLTKEKGKNPKKAKAWRLEFITDAVKKGVPETIAQRIWDEVVDKFQGYGFNVSHAVLYSMTGYKTAFLKAHYPIEFLLANLMAEVHSSTPDAKANIEKIKTEIRKHKVTLLKPDVNSSQLTYTLKNDKTLLTGLDALKFVGEDAIKDIIEKRPFKSFSDFMARVDSKKVRANSIQALCAAGALDSFNIHRKLIFLYVSDYRKKLQVWMKKHDPTKEEFIYPWPTEKDWTIPELYALEQFYLSEAFVCRPAEAYGKFFKDDHWNIGDVKAAKDKTKMSPIKGIIRSFFEFRVKKETSKYYGQFMIKAILEDKNGEQCMCTIFPDRWETVKKRLKEINSKAEFESGIAISFMGNTNNYEDEIGIILDQLYDLSLPPAVPADLKAKKINLKEAKAKMAEEVIKNTGEIKNLLEQIEDSMIEEGLLDDIDTDYEAD